MQTVISEASAPSNETSNEIWSNNRVHLTRRKRRDGDPRRSIKKGEFACQNITLIAPIVGNPSTHRLICSASLSNVHRVNRLSKSQKHRLQRRHLNARPEDRPSMPPKSIHPLPDALMPSVVVIRKYCRVFCCFCFSGHLVVTPFMPERSAWGSYTSSC